MGIKKVVTYINDEGFTFQHELIEDTLKIKKTKTGYEAKYLVNDEYPENPFEEDEGLGNFYHWKDCGKEQKIKYCELLGYDIDTREKIAPDNNLAVRIDKYEHSSIVHSVALEGIQCRWDTSSTWAVWYPTDCLIDDIKRFKTKQAQRKRCIELARGACKVHNQWANGEVYCLVKEEYNQNKEYINHDIVCGYFGYKEAEEALETEV